ncbi:pyrroline-5-carboxylate reductase [Fulvimarina sp. 2208YS6-2-32]|uniref:Pyrroline-5-carboxylate reductase n=1 Tax=Fulvimarina uroteuthidis TaxID=3098149 RepID=A0ABU5I3X6_9HYPH|nr:pyrroline-5-carboxylate reductase [Fulvimarina sp. 2208YS6-2-32]MDY8110085.1 pyrroline-5-carboxylate reductase [Fulvimarina sp. 2208YS6-2-32]
MTLDATRILVLGGGNMGCALMGGWLDAGLDPAGLLVVDPYKGEALAALIGRHGFRYEAEVPRDFAADVVLLAVKPQTMGEALPPIRNAIDTGALIVSIAAGTSLAALAHHLGDLPMVRAMPNTPSLIGRGITGAFANDKVSSAQQAIAQDLLSASGPVEWVETEALIDAVTGVSGSGPAYVFHLAECLAKAGEAAGLPADLAMRLARHTVAGAGELMIRSDETPAKLRKNVTSPKGTTEAGLSVLMDEADGLPPLIEKTVLAARDRAIALSRD